jgi:hypothetical protein
MVRPSGTLTGNISQPAECSIANIATFLDMGEHRISLTRSTPKDGAPGGLVTNA